MWENVFLVFIRNNFFSVVFNCLLLVDAFEKSLRNGIETCVLETWNYSFCCWFFILLFTRHTTLYPFLSDMMMNCTCQLQMMQLVSTPMTTVTAINSSFDLLFGNGSCQGDLLGTPPFLRGADVTMANVVQLHASDFSLVTMKS